MKDNEYYNQIRKECQERYEKTENRINYLIEYNEIRKEKLKTLIVCACGCSLTLSSKLRHEKSKKHLDLMEAKTSQQDTYQS